MGGDAYDVVIVGGGPAGSMAARSASARGAKVLLLERDSHIGLPVRCGEAVAVNNIGRFIEIDQRWITCELTGIMMNAPDGASVPVYADDQLGVILERAVFDRYLAETAAESGSDIITRADVDGLIIDYGIVKGISYSRLGRQHRVSAQVVIGADGVESRVGRWAGIKTQLAPRDMESAYQKTLAGIDYDYHYAHFYFGNEVAPCGYIWVFPKGKRTASVGIGIKTDRCDPGMAHRKLDEFIKRRFGNPAVVGEVAGGVPVANPLKKPFADGVILAGDAARHCNPLTGGGIYTAIVSGHYAGITAADAIADSDCSADRLQKFNKLIEKDIIVVHKRAYRLSEAVSKLNDDDLNRTAHNILSLPPEKRTLRNIFLKALISHPKLAVDIIKAFV